MPCVVSFFEIDVFFDDAIDVMVPSCPSEDTNELVEKEPMSSRCSGMLRFSAYVMCKPMSYTITNTCACVRNFSCRAG